MQDLRSRRFCVVQRAVTKDRCIQDRLRQVGDANDQRSLAGGEDGIIGIKHRRGAGQRAINQLDHIAARNIDSPGTVRLLHAIIDIVVQLKGDPATCRHVRGGKRNIQPTCRLRFGKVEVAIFTDRTDRNGHLRIINAEHLVRRPGIPRFIRHGGGQRIGAVRQPFQHAGRQAGLPGTAGLDGRGSAEAAPVTGQNQRQRLSGFHVGRRAADQLIDLLFSTIQHIICRDVVDEDRRYAGIYRQRGAGGGGVPCRIGGGDRQAVAAVGHTGQRCARDQR